MTSLYINTLYGVHSCIIMLGTVHFEDKLLYIIIELINEL
jgi:hypothetical protein